MSTISRSTSNQHISPSSVVHLSHYGSACDPQTLNSATPHLSHLRQSSSIHLTDEHHHHSHYPTSAAGYDVYEEIGVGAFATVYHASVKETGEQVAIKVIDLDQFNTNWEEIRREILIMSLVHHPNVVRILTSFVEEQDLWILMPWLEAGSCAHIMKTICPTGMKDEAIIATILKEVLHGLLYFHKDGRLHRDLKAGNVLISAQGEVQLADFGVAGTLMENGDRKKARTTFTGTPCWMAPEVMEHNENGYDEKADIWSFGILSLELAYGRAPYAKFPPMKVMVLTLQEEPPTAEVYKDHSYEFSRHFHSMVSKCLRKDPTKRPNVKKLLEHKFFKAAKDQSYLVEKIIKKMPIQRKPPTDKLLNLCALRQATVAQHSGEDGEKGKPVSVGSWVFDKAEFDQMKRQALEEKERSGSAGARQKSVQASYAEDEPMRRAAGTNIAASAGNQRPVQPASSESSSDEGGEDHSDDDAHRPLPNFSEPNSIDSTPSATTAVASSSSSASSHQLNVNLPTASLDNLQISGSQSNPPVNSPGEHQEGRFRVCDDEEDGEASRNNHSECNPYSDRYADPNATDGQQEYYQDSNQAAATGDETDHYQPQGGDHHEHHVGRFAITEDEDQ